MSSPAGAPELRLRAPAGSFARAGLGECTLRHQPTSGSNHPKNKNETYPTMEQHALGAVAPSTERTQQIVTRFFERLTARDPDGMAELFAERIDWYVPGDSALPWIGHRSNRAEVAG